MDVHAEVSEQPTKESNFPGKDKPVGNVTNVETVETGIRPRFRGNGLASWKAVRSTQKGMVDSHN